VTIEDRMLHVPSHGSSGPSEMSSETGSAAARRDFRRNR
jgi:hypothetical protein